MMRTGNPDLSAAHVMRRAADRPHRHPDTAAALRRWADHIDTYVERERRTNAAATATRGIQDWSATVIDHRTRIDAAVRDAGIPFPPLVYPYGGSDWTTPTRTGLRGAVTRWWHRPRRWLHHLDTPDPRD